MVRLLALSLLLLLSLPARADEYPTLPDEKDELCQDLLKSASSGISPKDAVWYQANCRCVDGVRCGHPGSPRFKAAVEAHRQAMEKKASSQREAEVTGALEACSAFAACAKSRKDESSTCDEAWARLEYRCSAAWRDLDACEEFIDAVAKDPAGANCAPLREPLPPDDAGGK